MVKVCCSGGFDPLHAGHLKLFQGARALGDWLTVILNNDEWLIAKKGYYVMPQAERKLILESIKYVNEVVIQIDTDGSIDNTLRLIRPNIFAKSVDRQGRSQAKVCEEIGCKRVWGLVPDEMRDGIKLHSSSTIVERAMRLSKKYDNN